MNRNQKIALGCGGAGCLGLIVVAIAGGLIYYFSLTRYTTRNYNFNINSNRTTNRNDNSNRNDNTNSSSTNSTSSMSSDDQHKLYQAAVMTGEPELVRRVSVKIGLMDDDYTPGSNYESFVAEHVSWVLRNGDFLQTINTPDKARAYINENL